MEYDHSWEVICVGLDDDSEFDDCRAVTELGYLAPVLRTRKVDAAASMIDSGLSQYHINHEGRKLQLKTAKAKYAYVRALDEDSPDDPLLSLPTIQEYKTRQKVER